MEDETNRTGEFSRRRKIITLPADITLGAIQMLRNCRGGGWVSSGERVERRTVQRY